MFIFLFYCCCWEFFFKKINIDSLWISHNTPIPSYISSAFATSLSKLNKIEFNRNKKIYLFVEFTVWHNEFYSIPLSPHIFTSQCLLHWSGLRSIAYATLSILGSHWDFSWISSFVTEILLFDICRASNFTCSCNL